jgi:cell division protein FtsL
MQLHSMRTSLRLALLIIVLVVAVNAVTLNYKSGQIYSYKYRAEHITRDRDEHGGFQTSSGTAHEVNITYS